MCIGLPLVFMALRTYLGQDWLIRLISYLDYIVQGHRFDIIEDFGCRPTIYYSIPAIFIVWMPPLLTASGALVYSGMPRPLPPITVPSETHMTSFQVSPSDIS